MRSGTFQNLFQASVSVLALSGGIGAFTSPALAQSTAANGQVETVVVTAERRSTNVQTTPISVSVLSADDLKKKSVYTLEQLQFSTPSLTFNNFGQGDEFNIRGLGKGENNVQTPSGVTTYVDGVAAAGGFFQTFPFYDLASVEVLRGPQGTFAGENATGGAVFLTTVKPDFDGYDGYAQAQVGNYSDVGLQGAVNMPITDDFAMRVSAFGERRDSFWSITGNPSGHPGDLNEGAVRLEFLWQPTAQFQAYLYGEDVYLDQGGYPADPATLSCPTPPAVAPTCVRNNSDPFKITSDTDQKGIQYGYRTVLDLKYTFASGIALRSLSGYQAGGGSEQTDLDGTNNVAYAGDLFYDHGEEKIISEEINLLSPTSGPFTWILGGFFQHDHVDLPAGNGFDIGIPTGAFDITLTYHTPKQHEALFGQVTYDITPALQVQAGLRYNHSTFDLMDQENLVFGGFVVPYFAAPCPATPIPGETCSNTTHQSDSALTGKLDLNYKLDSDNFLYTFVATGHKDGALNTTPDLNTTPAVVAPERVTDYEAGWKSNFFNEHLRTTLDGFYNDYKNFQVTVEVGPGQNGIENAPKATLWGFEAQGDAVFDALSFDFSGDYLHGTYGSASFEDSRFLEKVNIGGHQMVYQPQWSFNLGAQYAFDMGGGNTLTPRVDYAYVGSQTTTMFDVPGLDQLGVRNIVNAQLTYAMSNNWSVAAYATNLFNDHYIAAFSAGLGVMANTSPNLRDAGAPQQYGLRLTKTF